MSDDPSRPCTAFQGHRLLRSGPLTEVALAVRTASDAGSADPILVFDDATGRVVDLDLRGSDADIMERLSGPSRPPSGRRAASPGEAPAPAHGEAARPRGPGRPRLGVVAREVTLLPRHWEWLAAQPSGASAALRRLVDEARRMGGAPQARRAAQEAAYRFMQALGGDLPGYEEATRALFADDRAGLERHAAAWPEDVRAHALSLAFPSADRPEQQQPSPSREEAP